MSNLGTGRTSELRDPVNGVRAPQPPDLFINRQRRPSALGRDFANFDLGCYWLYWPANNPNVQEVWQLVSLQQVNNAPFGKWVLVTSGNGSLVTLTGDTGGPVPPLNGNINLLTGPAAGNPINNLVDIGTPLNNTITWSLNNSISQPNTNNTGTAGMYSLGLNRFMHNYGTANTFLGNSSGNLTLTVGSAVSNTCIGHENGMSLTTGSDNTMVGWACGSLITTGQYNNCVSAGGMASLTSGLYNTGLGHQVFSDVGAGLVSGSYNIAIGAGAASEFRSNESNNVIINSMGVVTDQNTLRIGEATGTGIQELDAAYVQGIYQRDVNATSLPVIVGLDGKLGTNVGGVPFYDTGTWIPTLKFGGASVGITYSRRDAVYTKIGNAVFISLTIVLTNKGASTGIATISGIPYNEAGVAPQEDFAFQWATGINFTAGNAVWGQLGGAVANEININENGPAASFTTFNNTNFTNTASFTIGGFYFTN